jgi:sialic acid synthase SpsE
MTYIIADAGVNWRNLNEADQLIKECANAGVNAVKFQAYSSLEIPIRNSISSFLLENMLTVDTVRYLSYRCQNHGVDFMCTPMYPDAVEMLTPYVDIWKIRFKDRNNINILKKIYATGKKTLISTDAVGTHPNAYYLFCVPEYPPISFPSLNRFDGFDGYSCHIPMVNHIADVVSHQKSRFLEVHAMLDRYENYEPIDQKVSLTISDLKRLIPKIRSQGGGLLNDTSAWV